jgi:predicted RNase H-like HicB family nuclease
MAQQLTMIEFKMRVPAAVKREGKWYVASCFPLDVHSQGLSEQEALNNLSEALQLFVESCFERGTLEQVLKDCGFEPLHAGVPAPAEGEQIIDVPLSLVAKHAAEAHQC